MTIPGQRLAARRTSRRQPEMGRDKDHREHQAGDDQADEQERRLERGDLRNVARDPVEQERSENAEEGEDEARHRPGDDEQEALRPEEEEGPRLLDAIGAVERGPDRLDAVRGEVDGDRHRDGEEAALRLAEDALHVRGDRLRDVFRPGVEEETRDARGKVGFANEARQRGDEDQEGEDRHQRRQRDVARHCPAIVVVEVAEGIAEDRAGLPEEGHDGRAPRSPKIGPAAYHDGKASASFGNAPHGGRVAMPGDFSGWPA